MSASNVLWVLSLIALYFLSPNQFLSIGLNSDMQMSQNSLMMNIYGFSTMVLVVVSLYRFTTVYQGQLVLIKKSVIPGLILGCVYTLSVLASTYTYDYLSSREHISAISFVFIFVPMISLFMYRKKMVSIVERVFLVTIGLILLIFFFLNGYRVNQWLITLVPILLWSLYTILQWLCSKRFDLIILQLMLHLVVFSVFTVLAVIGNEVVFVDASNFRVFFIYTLFTIILYTWIEYALAKEVKLSSFTILIFLPILLSLNGISFNQTDLSDLILMISFGVYAIAAIILVYINWVKKLKSKSETVQLLEKKQKWLNNQIWSKNHILLLMVFLASSISISYNTSFAFILAVFILIMNFRNLITILVSTLLYGLLFFISPELVGILAFIMVFLRISSLVSNRNALITSLFFYSGMFFVIVIHNSLQDVFITFMSAFALTIILHLLLMLNYMMSYSAKGLVQLTMGMPLLVLTIVLPNVIDNIDTWIIQPQQDPGFHTVSGHVRHFNDGSQTYVDSYIKTNPDDSIHNNLSNHS